jgi:putative hemolysin
MYVRRDGGSLLLSGWMPAEQFQELTGIPLPDDRSYHTVAGFVLDSCGALPAVGDGFDANGWRFEIMDLDGRRIDKVLATRLPPGRRVNQAGTRPRPSS